VVCNRAAAVYSQLLTVPPQAFEHRPHQGAVASRKKSFYLSRHQPELQAHCGRFKGKAARLRPDFMLLSAFAFGRPDAADGVLLTLTNRLRWRLLSRSPSRTIIPTIRRFGAIRFKAFRIATGFFGQFRCDFKLSSAWGFGFP
jgi:hypothetical protein